jgi:protein tyrosine/serine phosphatase
VLVRQRQEVQALPRELSAANEVAERLAGEERILDWDGALNARDTGGLPTSDGRRVKRGALVRSDVLSRLTPSGQAALVDHGVRTIVDVRSTEETELDRESYPFRDRSVAYLNVPFNKIPDEELRARYASALSREEFNRLDLDHGRSGLGAIVSAIADAIPGGVLVHCHAGKDRTGLVVAVLLALVGVDDESIADDYALTARNLEPLIVDWLDSMSNDEAERARLRDLAHPRREAMLDTLRYLRERYGSAAQYLLGAAVTEKQIKRLHERLVER